MKVIVIGGDGDIAGIGGNHLMHAARRNIDLLVIMVNNMVYAMTGGQLAPTTPTGLYTTTTPYGNPERPINVIKLVATMGANYVATASVTHPPLIEKYVYRALEKKGFAFIEIISTCPEVFGRHIGLRDAVDLLNALKKRVVVKQRPHIDESYYEWDTGKFVIGEYVDKDDPSYLERIGVIKK
jgi:2-oxoglutarate ferredoxin oxidoreductase subunit beta